METDVYRLISHPLQDPSTLRGGLAIHKKIAGLSPLTYMHGVKAFEK